jgi:hypothetical protein
VWGGAWQLIWRTLYRNEELYLAEVHACKKVKLDTAVLIESMRAQLAEAHSSAAKEVTHFTCFASTKVQILTLKVLQPRERSIDVA